MIHVKLLADFGEALFPIAFVCHGVGVGAPKFRDHLALGNEWALGFWISMRVVQSAQGQLRAGHQGRFVRSTEMRVEFVRGLVERAPAFRVSLAPKRRLGIQPQ